MREDRDVVASRVRVVRLTPELADSVANEADLALYGDGQCSLGNLETSCFVSEACSASPTERIPLVRKRLLSMCAGEDAEAYVALVDEDARTHFVGCVQIFNPTRAGAPTTFPTMHFHPTDRFLFSLCVADTYRSYGVGNMFLRQAVQTCRARGSRLFLFVARPSNGTSTVQRFMTTRCDRLKEMYRKRGFEVACTAPLYVLMRYSQ